MTEFFVRILSDPFATAALGAAAVILLQVMQTASKIQQDNNDDSALDNDRAAVAYEATKTLIDFFRDSKHAKGVEAAQCVGECVIHVMTGDGCKHEEPPVDAATAK